MEKKINIAELLKDCPKGMELYSPIFGKVYLDKVRPHLAIVVTTDKEQGDFKEEFLYDGRYGMNGECMLFPSKGKTTWEGFRRPLRDGDIVYIKTKDYNHKEFVIIFKEIKNDHIYRYVALSQQALFILKNTVCHLIDVEEIRLATEEEKTKLFKAIKDNGYRWNDETKTLEKVIDPKFKKGDKVRVKNGVSETRIIEDVYDTFYTLVSIGKIDFTDQDNWELLVEPKFKVGNKIIGKYTKNIYTISHITPTGYELTNGQSFDFDDEDCYESVPKKFDVDTLKPFDKVLVRDFDNTPWEIEFFQDYLMENILNV